jgi:hypothetical protein
MLNHMANLFPPEYSGEVLVVSLTTDDIFTGSILFLVFIGLCKW